MSIVSPGNTGTASCSKISPLSISSYNVESNNKKTIITEVYRDSGELIDQLNISMYDSCYIYNALVLKQSRLIPRYGLLCYNNIDHFISAYWWYLLL